MIQEIEIEKLTLLEDNPRQVRTGAIERLAKSLNSPRGIELFKKRPVLANDRDGKLIVYAGNQRLRAAKALGWDKVPCIVDKISLKEEREETIKDNLVIGEWDDDLLANNYEIEDLESWGMDLKDLGIEPLGEDETDDVPEPPKEARAERGKIYTLGKHRVMCGDSTNAGDVALLMDGKKADMVFTDPPYGVSYGAKNEFLNAIARGNCIQTPIENDQKNEEEIQDFWVKAFGCIRDVLADVNSYYITGPQIQGMMMMMMMMMKAGLPYRHVIIWVKNNHVLGRCDYNYKHEPLFFGWTKTHKFYGNGEFKTSVWEVDKPHKSDLHPTMKPIRLIVNALLNSSENGQICLDSFLGSGSTLIACEQTSRVCYGMEIDPRYVDVIIERFCNYTGQDKEEIYATAR